MNILGVSALNLIYPLLLHHYLLQFYNYLLLTQFDGLLH